MSSQQKNAADRETLTLRGSSLGGSYRVVKGLLLEGLLLLILLTLQVHNCALILIYSFNCHQLNQLIN